MTLDVEDESAVPDTAENPPRANRHGCAQKATRRGEAEARLLDAAVEVATRRGYAELTVAGVLADAGVSRASFYQYFSNVEDCFWSAYRTHAHALCARISCALANAEDGLAAVLDLLACETAESPKVARLLMSEPLAAGQTGLLERDKLIAKIETQIRSAPGGTDGELPLQLVIGAAFRFLAMTLDVAELADERPQALAAWLAAFRSAHSGSRWSERFAPPAPAGAGSMTLPTTPGHTRENTRLRVLRATAATVAERGFTAISVADIAAAAGISRRAFYNECPNKTAAFIGAYEYALQQALTACAPAFFSTGSWPERVWESGHAFTGFLAREPALGYLGFVECFAAGRDFSQRVNESQLAFTLFLEEGHRQGGQIVPASRAVAALTAVAIAELGFQAARSAPGIHARRIMPLAVHIALAPFIGSEGSRAFIEGKIEEQSSRGSLRGGTSAALLL